MERKVDEIFDYEGKKLKVIESKSNGCAGCFFDEQHILCSNKVLGYCGSKFRTDKKEIIFIEVTEQNQMEQKLNLCKILKYCPQGEIFWSPMLGNVKFDSIDHEWQIIYVISETGATWHFNSDATITLDYVTSAEIMLYPSKKQRDWSKFIAPCIKKDRFNPKTLKPFDRVIARSTLNSKWRCTFFSHLIDDERRVLKCITSDYSYPFCIPYNDETKHLAGTTEEAPEYYRYWEN